MPVICMRVLKVGINVTSLILHHKTHKTSFKCMVINRSKMKMRRQFFVPLFCLTDHNSRSLISSREVKLSFYGRNLLLIGPWEFISANFVLFFHVLLCSENCARCRNLTNWRQYFSVCYNKIMSWHRQSFVDPRTQQFYSNLRNLSSITNPARSLAAGDTHGNFIGIKFDT